MAKTDPVFGGSVESPPEPAATPLRGGTIRLLSADANKSARKTEPMLGPDGLLRDTVRDLLPVERAVELPRAPGKPVVASDRKVALEGFVPRSSVPAGSVGPKVDVSRVDPRRAPTQKVLRRPAGAAESGLEVEGHGGAMGARARAAEPRRARGAEPVWVVLAVLLVGAVALVGALAWRLSASSSTAPGRSEGSVK